MICHLRLPLPAPALVQINASLWLAQSHARSIPLSRFAPWMAEARFAYPSTPHRAGHSAPDPVTITGGHYSRLSCMDHALQILRFSRAKQFCDILFHFHLR